jgi:hypothetical protein
MLTGLAVLGDVLKLADSLGIEEQAATEIVRNGPLAGVLGRYENTDGRFLVPHAAKDLGLALAADPELPTVRAAYDAMAAAATALPDSDVRLAVDHLRGVSRS